MLVVACVASTNHTGHTYAQNGLLDRLAAINLLSPSESSWVSHVEAKRFGLGAAASVVVLAGQARSLPLMIAIARAPGTVVGCDDTALEEHCCLYVVWKSCTGHQSWCGSFEEPENHRVQWDDFSKQRGGSCPALLML